jgi:uncharacterized OB-fold protein
MSSLPAERIVGGINADEPYWEYLAAGEFRLSHCAGCGRTIWPAHFRCGECGSWDMEWVATEPVGTVYSWTRTWYSFDRTTERADEIPYVTVLCEVDGADGARVMGILEGDERAVKVGARVRGVIKPPSPKSKNYPSICWVIDTTT